MTCYLNISDRAQFGQLCLTISYNSVQCSSVIESLISQLPGGKSLGGGRTLGRKASRSMFL